MKYRLLFLSLICLFSASCSENHEVTETKFTSSITSGVTSCITIQRAPFVIMPGKLPVLYEIFRDPVGSKTWDFQSAEPVVVHYSAFGKEITSETIIIKIPDDFSKNQSDYLRTNLILNIPDSTKEISVEFGSSGLAIKISD